MGELVLAAVIIVSCAVGVLWVPRIRSNPCEHGGVLRHPGTWLAVVVGAMMVNQILFTAFVDQAWNGDPSPVAMYLPSGWFDLADLGSTADVLPAWPWTVLHVQAALELPFVMSAYLLVCRWFGADAFGRLIAARWLISASFTITFCLIEWDLHNPYTVVDIVIRVVAAVVTPLLLPLLAAGGSGPPALLPFALSAAALGAMVLAVYDVATLYNLGHAMSWTPSVGIALVVLLGARLWARRDVPARRVAGSAAASLGWFLTVFAVPALAVRYGFNFGVAPLSMASGLLIVGVALWRGWDRQMLPQLGIAAVTGSAGAAIGAAVAHGHPEATLLAAATGFVLLAGAACAVLDRREAVRT
ncbi:hypothetical protein [Williamsia sp.]|uniref:hypothetical protein n=1 Tax=Williamsia sp. TaxID=1872085 RepID=UPI001A32E87A|nr:hypothetical protein [Williamsia sp.]MBJ7288439.1 hypothetical protein [Williamsia sp.]